MIDGHFLSKNIWSLNHQLLQLKISFLFRHHILPEQSKYPKESKSKTQTCFYLALKPSFHQFHKFQIPQFPHYENRVLYNKPYINKNEWYYKQTPTDDYIGKKYKKYINNIIPSIKIMIKKEIKKIKEIKNNYELTCND